ncbi:hypothetical protein KIN20_025442 [Parelaphostrongylus tenuis]|uniref:Uncharacterized protein n=1 Tax=Parelaphostrongylus tenuis TaxID=148309 RepID=A0AAD5NDD2_PARTN|nr:hypothetical protein KIN20_025442 [Parelaphostrongylus tenuis]
MKRYGGMIAYSRSKMAQVMFTRHLAKLLDERNLPVTVTVCHPGNVDTNILSESGYSWLSVIFRPIMWFLLKQKMTVLKCRCIWHSVRKYKRVMGNTSEILLFMMWSRNANKVMHVKRCMRSRDEQLGYPAQPVKKTLKVGMMFVENSTSVDSYIGYR